MRPYGRVSLIYYRTSMLYKQASGIYIGKSSEMKLEKNVLYMFA